MLSEDFCPCWQPSTQSRNMTAHHIDTIAVHLFVCAGPQPGCQPLPSNWLLTTRKSSAALSFNPLQQAFGTHASIQKRVVKSDFRISTHLILNLGGTKMLVVTHARVLQLFCKGFQSIQALMRNDGGLSSFPSSLLLTDTQEACNLNPTKWWSFCFNGSPLENVFLHK